MTEVQLSPENQRFIEDAVVKGRYASVSHAVNRAMELLQREDGPVELTDAERESIRREVLKGIESGEREGTVEIELESFLREMHEEQARKQRPA